MKSLRRRIVLFGVALAVWEALNPHGARWSFVATFELGLAVALLFTFIGPGKGTRWSG